MRDRKEYAQMTDRAQDSMEYKMRSQKQGWEAKRMTEV